MTSSKDKFFGRPISLALVCLQLSLAVFLATFVFCQVMLPTLSLLFTKGSPPNLSWIKLNLVLWIASYCGFTVWVGLIVRSIWSGKSWAWNHGLGFYVALCILTLLVSGVTLPNSIAVVIGAVIFGLPFIDSSTRTFCSLSDVNLHSCVLVVFRPLLLYILLLLLLGGWIRYIATLVKILPGSP